MVKELATFVGNVERCYCQKTDIPEGFETHIHCPDFSADKMSIFLIYDKNPHRINRGEFVTIRYDSDTGIVQSYSIWKSKQEFEKKSIPLYSFGELR